MSTTEEYADVWAAERPRLTGLAYRILGSWHDAEDVVAVAGERLVKLAADGDPLGNPQGWLTRVVTRAAIDVGRRAITRRETYIGPWLPEPVATERLPDEVAVNGSLLGLAMLRLMEQLSPEDRAIFVLREAFDVPYGEISECVGRSPAACRQVVSRARKVLRVDDSHSPGDQSTPDLQLLTALVNAVTAGQIDDVVRLLSEDSVLWADGGGIVAAARRPIMGAEAIATFLVAVGRLVESIEAVHVNGTPAMLFHARAGSYLYVTERSNGLVTAIQVHANPQKLMAARPPSRPVEDHLPPATQLIEGN
ncbi:sigma-70 family RNA polymerase sigma factor [Micrococcus luteus]|uniref:sigma-70 family RNA polymerase sigma factor n=1 Tax=Micrococcus luteus TaxID=1270 RepID=UPI0015D94E21|nr:sigma-70 family RNA polymerase sigma factor [Micrococcus luteus]